MVALAARIANFACNTSTGNQTITATSGVAATPKAAIVVIGGATTAAAITAHARMGLGMTDGTNSRAMGFMAEDAIGAGTADTGFRIDNAAVVNIPLTGSEAIDARATFVSFGTDNITINWADAPATALLGFVVFFYGDDLKPNVTNLASSATIGGTASVTGLPFAPNTLIAFSCSQTFAASSGGNQGRIQIGFATAGNVIRQCCQSMLAVDRVNPTNCTGVARDDSIVGGIGPTTEGARVEVTSFNSDGFTVTTRNAANSIDAAYLSLSTGTYNRTWTGVPSIDESSASSQATTEPNLRPYLLLQIGSHISNINTYSANASRGVSFGAVASSSSIVSGCASVFVVDAVTTSDTASFVSQTQYSRPLIDTSTTDHAISHSSFDIAGFTATVDIASSSNRQDMWLAIGDNQLVSISDVVEISEQPAFKRAISFLETVEISEQPAPIIGLLLPLSETEQLIESVVLKAQVMSNVVLAISETENILESFDEFRNPHFLVFRDTEEISETIQRAERVFLSITETVEIGESIVLRPGAVLALSDVVQISEGFLIGRVVGMTSGPRGSSFQAGAELGGGTSAGSSRGETEG